MYSDVAVAWERYLRLKSCVDIIVTDQVVLRSSFLMGEAAAWLITDFSQVDVMIFYRFRVSKGSEAREEEELCIFIYSSRY